MSSEFVLQSLAPISVFFLVFATCLLPCTEGDSAFFELGSKNPSAELHYFAQGHTTEYLNRTDLTHLCNLYQRCMQSKRMDLPVLQAFEKTGPKSKPTQCTCHPSISKVCTKALHLIKSSPGSGILQPLVFLLLSQAQNFECH